MTQDLTDVTIKTDTLGYSWDANLGNPGRNPDLDSSQYLPVLTHY